MSQLIDSSFFVGEINIPNTSKPEVQQSLNLFIQKYESELLTSLLGYELYNVMGSGQGAQRFTDLIIGNSELGWKGLVFTYYNVDGEQQYSLIAYYVYYWWVKDKQIWNSGVGTVRPKGDSAEVMPIYLKQMEAWNTFSKLTCEFIDFMSSNSDTYPEWKPVNLWQFAPINDFDI